jgi:hypothetical protein
VLADSGYYSMAKTIMYVAQLCICRCRVKSLQLASIGSVLIAFHIMGRNVAIIVSLTLYVFLD